MVREAVWSCYQERPTMFRGQELFDPGAFPADPIYGTITWRVRQPWYAPRSEEEQAAVDRMHLLMDQIREKSERKRRAEQRPETDEQ